MNVLFLVPYPLAEAPSQRFRFEQYFSILRASGFSFQVQSFLTYGNWKVFYSDGKSFQKLIALAMGFVRRFSILFRLNSADFIFIHREAAPVGPPAIEWIIAKIFRKKIIYDFDDAIWATDKKNENQVEKIIRWRSKVKSICKWSYKVSCGNDYLCNYARQFNLNVILNPTTIDTEYLHNPDHHLKNRTEKITIGWTGSHSTLKYLESLVSVIQKLENKYPRLQFLVIANKRPNLNLKSLIFIPWSIESEIDDLIKMDIGVMPLPDDEWSMGKCGFKLLQYMALNIPAIASPVGVNAKIINEGINGFLCTHEQEWVSTIEQLINNEELRLAIASKGRLTVENHYSVSSNAENFVSLFI